MQQSSGKKNETSQCQEHSTLLYCYAKALDRYRLKRPREGCLPTFFTKFRHSFKEYSALSKLRKALAVEPDIIAALTLVANHLVRETSTFNNHSFNNYFLDELKKSFQQVDWDCFTPNAVKKYTGCLYRGDTRPPTVIFDSRFTERYSSHCDSDYQRFYTGKIGISTSKDINVAMFYPKSSKKSMLKRLLQGQIWTPLPPIDRYVYVIDYCGVDGFDILKTGQARGLNFSSILHPDRSGALNDHEVNIKGPIISEHIKGSYKLQNNGSLSWIENLKYVPTNCSRSN